MAGDYIHTAGGGKFEYGALDTEVSIDDVAHHLGNIARFAGATMWHYSVAQHSVLVAVILKRQGYDLRAQRMGLLHDAHEFALTDIPTPCQRWITKDVSDGRNFIEEAKERLDDIILPQLTPDWPIAPHEHHMIGCADKLAFLTEANQLFRVRPKWVDENARALNMLPLDIIIPQMYPEQARDSFLAKYRELNDAIDPPSQPVCDAVAA